MSQNTNTLPNNPQPTGWLPPKDLTRINLVRIIATFLIVMAHFDPRWGGGLDWIQTLYYTLTRAGVPLFFMSTGYLLLSQQESILSFTRKHLLPFLLSFFVWSSFYDLQANDILHKGTTWLGIVKTFLHVLRNATIGYFWFFYPLIGLYIFTPLLRLIIKTDQKKVVIYYIGLWFLSFAIAPILRYVIDLKYGYEAPLVQRYLGYFLLGYCLMAKQDSPKCHYYALGIFLSSFLFTFAVFFFNLPPTDNEDFFRSYMSFNIISLSASLFLTLKSIGLFLPVSLHDWLEQIDRTTFGIYLIHPIIAGWIFNGAQLFGATLPYETAIISPVVSLGVFLVSAFVTAILQKIPLINHTIPQLGKTHIS
jgi:surface polysaccharide O-acyltransferase-like enzyme